MRIFLTRSQDFEWRWKICKFLKEHQIEFFDSADFSLEYASIFKYLKILERCDALIAYLAGWEQQHLETILELNYASELAKDVMVVNGINQKNSWSPTLPYTISFATLDELKEHLVTTMSSPKKHPHLVG